MTATVHLHPRLRTRRIAIAHHGRLTRFALCHLLASHPALEVVGATGDGRGAVALARRLQPDCLVLDAGVRRLGWLEATRRIAATTRTAVVVLSPSPSEELVAAALDAGAIGVVLEDGDPADLIETVRLGAPIPQEALMHPADVIEIRRGSAHRIPAVRTAPPRGARQDVRLVKTPIARSAQR